MISFILECISSSVTDTDYDLLADLDSISWDTIYPENNYPIQGSFSNFFQFIKVLGYFNYFISFIDGVNENYYFQHGNGSVPADDGSSNRRFQNLKPPFAAGNFGFKLLF